MTSIFVSHPNRELTATTIAHEYAQFIRKNSRFGVWLDTEHFPKSQILSKNKIKQILKEGFNKCGIFLGFYFPTDSISRSRQDTWYKTEENMAIYRNLPIIQVFLRGSKSSPHQRSYSKLYKFYYFKFSNWRSE